MPKGNDALSPEDALNDLFDQIEKMPLTLHELNRIQTQLDVFAIELDYKETMHKIELHLERINTWVKKVKTENGISKRGTLETLEKLLDNINVGTHL